MKPIQLFSLCVLLCLATPATAGTIYSWTDAEGKQHFSDKQPPETIKNYKVIKTKPNASDKKAQASERRSSYDSMADRARQESDQLDQQRRAEDKAREIQEKQEAEARRKAKNEPELRRLEKAIKDLENRALSRTFSQGMKNAQIEALRKQIKQLDTPPE